MRLNRHRCGFSLIELVTSLAIISILMVAMGSAMLIATRGMPDPNSPFARKMDAAQVVGQLADEVTYATAVLTMSPTELEFVVDRNGTPITIAYSWSGTPGDPLTYQYDAGTVVTVIENVQDFTLTYIVTSPAPGEAAEGPPIEGPEELFIEQDESNSGTAGVFAITSDDKCAEYFSPVLPGDAVSWRITRVKFIANPSGSSGNLRIEVMTENPGTGQPGNIVDGVTVSEGDLVADNWHEVQFANAGGLSPSDAFFIVFRRWSGGGIQGLLKIGTDSLDSPDTIYWENSGNWLEFPTTDIWLWIWGTVTAPDPNPPPPPPPTEAWLHSVQIELQVGTDTSTKTQTAVQVFNAPSVVGL